MVGGDLGGRAGHRCRHERVSVAISTHPGSDPHERRHDRRNRAGTLTLQRVVDASVHMRHRREQRLIEDAHDGAHLVGGRGLLRAQRRGAPQGVDLFEHATQRAVLFGAAFAGGIMGGEQIAQPTDAGRHGPAASLGRVRGEHGLKAQAVQAPACFLIAHLTAQLRVGGGHRVDGILTSGLTSPLAQHPHALVLLGEIDQMEVAGEGPRDLVCPFDRERLRDRRRPLERVVGLLVERLNGRQAQPFDIFVQAGGAGLAQHLSEQAAQHAHVGAHRVGDAV